MFDDEFVFRMATKPVDAQIQLARRGRSSSGIDQESSHNVLRISNGESLATWPRPVHRISVGPGKNCRCRFVTNLTRCPAKQSNATIERECSRPGHDSQIRRRRGRGIGNLNQSHPVQPSVGTATPDDQAVSAFAECVNRAGR